MIYTITLNPAIDHLLQANKFVVKETNYYQNDQEIVGGKGINVGVLLKNLEVDVLLLGLLGKDNLEIFSKTFQEINLKEKFLHFQGRTRTNYKIRDLQTNEETELNGEGQATDADAQKILDFLEQNLQENDFVVASGSVPKAINSQIYEKIGLIVQQKKAIFILDTSKIWLKNALGTKPYLIKPNIAEICDLLNLELKATYSLTELQAMVQELQKLGAQNVLVSRGKEGSVYFTNQQEIYEINTAQGTLVSSVGAGDSMVGGFVYGLVKQLPIEETLKYAAASGAATAFSQWIGDQELIQSLLPQIQVKKR